MKNKGRAGDETDMKRITVIIIVIMLVFSGFAFPETVDGIDLEDQFSPHFLKYLRMYEALILYEGILDRGGWPVIAAGSSLSRGDYGERVLALRKRLLATGDLQEKELYDQFLFDQSLENAVKRFQYRHGLKIDGIVGSNTLQVLNVPPEKRIEQILLNMKRMWHFTEKPGNKYIVVNIPEFKLRLIDNGEVVIESRAIVGRKERQTPVLSDRIIFLVLNPSWRIPGRIAVNDILPKIRNSPDYLTQNNIRVFRDWNFTNEVDHDSIDWSKINAENFNFLLRQDPGVKNQLGCVKFIFPNDYEVYIHDTPDRYLFDLNNRALSSGCIRIEKSLELAEYLLRDNPDLTGREIIKLLDSGEEKTIALKNPLPVYLVYWTSWVTSDGTINFRNDIYGHDRVQLNQQGL